MLSLTKKLQPIFHTSTKFCAEYINVRSSMIEKRHVHRKSFSFIDCGFPIKNNLSALLNDTLEVRLCKMKFLVLKIKPTCLHALV